MTFDESSGAIQAYTNVDDIVQFTNVLSYAIRLKQGQIMNIEQDLTFGQLTGDYLGSLVILLQTVFTPTFEGMSFGPRLSEQQVDVFVSTCRRFMDNL